MPNFDNPFESPKVSAVHGVNRRGGLGRLLVWIFAGVTVGGGAFIGCVALIHYLTHTYAGKTPELYFGEQLVSYDNQFYIAIFLLCVFVMFGAYVGSRLARRVGKSETVDCEND